MKWPPDLTDTSRANVRKFFLECDAEGEGDCGVISSHAVEMLCGSLFSSCWVSYHVWVYYRVKKYIEVAHAELGSQICEKMDDSIKIGIKIL